MVTLFKKPDLHQKEREAYLKELESKIQAKEHELENIVIRSAEVKKNLEESLAQSSGAIQRQISEIDSILQIKRAERVELDKPIIDRHKALDVRAGELDARAKTIDEKEQQLFERERQLENRLESLKDLSDELGESRTRLQIKEKLLLGRESALTNRENAYLLAIESYNAREKQFAEMLQEREYAIQLKELNLQGQENNLKHRERELQEGFVLLNDRRTLLEKGWKELKEKQYGRSSKLISKGR